MSEDDARAWFQEMDKDGDATVDEAEYLEAMLKLTDDLSPQQFEHRIKDLLARTNKEVTDPRWYYHCENNREYLEAEVVPLVESGLNEMMRAIEAERLRVASGKDWDEDGHVPPDWRPIAPFSFSASTSAKTRGRWFESARRRRGSPRRRPPRPST